MPPTEILPSHNASVKVSHDREYPESRGRRVRPTAAGAPSRRPDPRRGRCVLGDARRRVRPGARVADPHHVDVRDCAAERDRARARTGRDRRPVRPVESPRLQPVVVAAFVSALAEVTPAIRVGSAHETVNQLNEQGLAGEYAELMAGFARSRILDRDRLRRIGSVLGSRYVFLPGVAELDHDLVDKFEMAGFKLIRNQVTRLRLWLQLWDAQSGRILWESIGEATVANPILSAVQATPLDAIAQGLWRRMIQDDLVSRKSDRATSSVSGAGSGAHPRHE
jgi:hypothetical protein